MSAVSESTGKPGGLRAWWLKLWRPSFALAPRQAQAPDASPTPRAGPSPASQGQGVEPTRITKEAVLQLPAAGPEPEPTPDLLQQRANFWAAATHDLCQPAQALALFLERLRSMPPQAPTQALHGYLQSSMEDLTRLLMGLMELAQIDAGEVQASTMAVAVDEVLSRLQEQLTAQAHAKGLRLVVRSRGQFVVGDAALIERILLALGRNALQFCERGTVLLSVRPVQGGRALRLDVSDSGPGIAPRDHRIIFEPFAQRNLADPQGPRRPSLGLHIASRHAQLMGTRLQLRSALGRGSRFSLTLPLADVPAALRCKEQAHVLESWGLDGLQVAVCDKDAARATLVRGWLRSWGCVVAGEPAQDGIPSPEVQAMICAWQAHAPDAAARQIEAFRAGREKPLPACIIDFDGGASGLPEVPADTTFLGQPVQAAQLRAWLRRAVVR